MTNRTAKDPLLVYLAMAALVLTLISLVTWLGRPSSSIGTTTVTDTARAVASIQDGSAESSAGTSMELVRLRLACTDFPEVIRVAQHQHQVQFQLQRCPMLAEGAPPLELTGSVDPGPLILFPSDKVGLLDSEIVQLKEGVNTFTLEWMDQGGSLRTFELQIHRG